ncbi:hypothetical protein [Bacillus safensis]|nr:hypothetical protein [Bacillus safensis]
MMNFQHKTVIITGAANGIGEAVACGYAKEGEAFGGAAEKGVL